MKKNITFIALLLLLIIGCNNSQKGVADSKGTAKAITNDNYNTLIKGKDGVSLLYFWAVWCGPCRMTAPIVEELAGEYEGKALIGKVNVDDAPEIAGEYGIRSIPTFVILKDGKVVGREVGVVGKRKLTAKLGKALGK